MYCKLSLALFWVHTYFANHFIITIHTYYIILKRNIYDNYAIIKYNISNFYNVTSVVLLYLIVALIQHMFVLFVCVWIDTMYVCGVYGYIIGLITYVCDVHGMESKSMKLVTIMVNVMDTYCIAGYVCDCLTIRMVSIFQMFYDWIEKK